MVTELSAMCLAFIGVRMFSAINRRKGILFIIIGYSLIVACAGCVQWGLDMSVGNKWNNILFFSNSGIWGAWAGIGLVVVMGISQRSQYVVCWRIFICIFSVLLLLSRSRASWLGVVVSIGYYLLNNKAVVYYLKNHLYVIFACGMVAMIACWGLYRYKQPSADGRLLIWKVSSGMIAAHPWVGQGKDAFRQHYLYAQADYFRHYFKREEIMRADNVAYPYNELLKLSLEYGVIGVMLFAALFLSCLLRKCENQIDVILCALLLFLGVYGLFAYPSDIWNLQMLLFCVMGCLSIEKQRYSRGKCFFYCAFLCFSSIVCYGLFRYRYLEYLVNDIIRENVDRTFLPVSQLKDLESYPMLYERYVQYCSMKSPDSLQTLEILEEAIRYIPSSPLFCELGDCYLKQGLILQSEEAYKQAKFILPGRFLPRYKLFSLYRRYGKQTEAVEEAREILSLPVKIDNTLSLKIRGEVRRFLYKTQRQETAFGK